MGLKGYVGEGWEKQDNSNNLELYGCLNIQLVD
jgi:hypothetical protein